MTRKGGRGSASGEVDLTPMIDCVFLLLVFFLVTSMIKRYERQIPMNLGDTTASVSDVAKEDAYILGVNMAGQLHMQSQRSSRGVMGFQPVADPVAFLKDLAEQRGVQVPVELIVERETPFQTVIHILDLLELQGFENVRSRVRDGEL